MCCPWTSKHLDSAEFNHIGEIVITTADREGIERPLSARFGLRAMSARWSLLKVKRTYPGHREKTAFDPSRTSAFETCCVARGWLTLVSLQPWESLL
jgi:hypothetical protein